MKEFAKYLARRYSVVNADDDEAMTNNLSQHHGENATNSSEKHKSLRTKHSVNTSGILNSFFNERRNSNRGRSPTCK